MQSQQQFIYENFRSGAAQPCVCKDIATLDFPVITLAEHNIVAKLDAVFAEIENAKFSLEQKKCTTGILLELQFCLSLKGLINASQGYEQVCDFVRGPFEV